MASNLKDLLFSIINPKNNWRSTLLCQWHEIIGPLNSKVRIEKIYDETVVLGVFHSCWMQELSLLSPILINKINEKLDQAHIKQIRFKYIGAKKIKKQKTREKVTPQNNTQLTKKDESTLAKITDPGLRDVLKAFRIRCYLES